MRHAPLALTVAIAGALTPAMAAPAGAQILNGTFDSGLTDWTVTTTDSGGATAAFGNGNPGPGAQLWDMNDSAGSATLTQTFDCGGSGDDLCIISLEYATDVTGGANMAVTITLDNLVVYSAIHNSTVQAYTPVLFSAPCGEHTLEISAGSSNTAPFSHWMMIVDNVTASCVPAVSTEDRTWTGLKATYR